MAKNLRTEPQNAPTPIAWDDDVALRFALDFAQMEREDAIRQKTQVLDFMNTFSEEDRPEIDSAIVAIHEEAQRLVRDLQTDGYASYDVRVIGLIGRRTVRPATTTGQLPEVGINLMPNTMGTPLRDRFFRRLMLMLESPIGARVRICQALKPREDAICGRLFVKTTRKEYCSDTCQSRAYMRRTYQPKGRKGHGSNKTARPRGR